LRKDGGKNNEPLRREEREERIFFPLAGGTSEKKVFVLSDGGDEASFIRSVHPALIKVLS